MFYVWLICELIFRLQIVGNLHKRRTLQSLLFVAIEFDCYCLIKLFTVEVIFRLCSKKKNNDRDYAPLKISKLNTTKSRPKYHGQLNHLLLESVKLSVHFAILFVLWKLKCQSRIHCLYNLTVDWILLDRAVISSKNVTLIMSRITREIITTNNAVRPNLPFK